MRTQVTAFVLAALIMVVAIPGTALAVANIQAPEIDGSSLAAGLGVAMAGALILRSRMSK